MRPVSVVTTGKSLIDIVNETITKSGGIANYYNQVCAEVFTAPNLPKRRNCSVLRYRYTVDYLKKNCDLLPAHALAAEIGVKTSEVLTRLKQLGIKKKMVTPDYKRYFEASQFNYKPVLNVEAGIFYESCTEAAKTLNLNLRTFHKNIQKKGFYKHFIAA